MHLGIEIAGHGGNERAHVQGAGGRGGEAADVGGGGGVRRRHAVSIGGGDRRLMLRMGSFGNSGKYRAGRWASQILGGSRYCLIDN
jgi:hypothetical protein